MLTALMTLGGLVGLLIGGEMIVRGAVATALRLGLSPLLIGLTIVAFGTSAPEVVTSVQAALAGAPALAVGNVVGSNIANVLLVVGLCALVRPMVVARVEFRRDAWAMTIGTLIGIGVLFLGYFYFIDRFVGIALVALLVSYLVFAYFYERRAKKKAIKKRQEAAQSAAAEKSEATRASTRGEAPTQSSDDVATSAEKEAEEIAEAGLAGKQPRLSLSLLNTFVGLALILVGAHLLVVGAVDIARYFGLTEATIGATIVAIGTSLPEMVTSIVAAFRGQSGVAIGNVLGSNLFNILGVLGATAIALPFAVPGEVITIDIWVMLAATLTLLFLTTRRPIIRRPVGALLFCCYIGYLALLLT